MVRPGPVVRRVVADVAAFLDDGSAGMGARRREKASRPTPVIDLVVVAEDQVHVLAAIGAHRRQDLGCRSHVFVDEPDSHALGHLRRMTGIEFEPPVMPGQPQFDRVDRRLLRQKRGERLAEIGKARRNRRQRDDRAAHTVPPWRVQ